MSHPGIWTGNASPGRTGAGGNTQVRQQGKGLPICPSFSKDPTHSFQQLLSDLRAASLWGFHWELESYMQYVSLLGDGVVTARGPAHLHLHRGAPTPALPVSYLK